LEQTCLTANRKDFISGLVFIAIGLIFAVLGRDLEIGSATRMGPGYFPLVLCGLMILIGVVISARALGQAPGEPLGGVPWRAILLILPALVFFGYAVRGVGLVPAVMTVAIASALASRKTTVPLAIGLAVVLAVFCSAVFVYGLGLPIQLFGPWVRFW
jgi:hypothetical protein